MKSWLFDLGNTRLKCAQLQDDGRVGEVMAVDHDGERLAPDWDARLPPRIEAAYVASVVATPLRVQLLDALARRCGRICLASPSSAFDGIAIAYAQPGKLGVDRFLALLAARARGEAAWLVVGIGTALTIDLLDAEGRHRGGRIAPSPALMREALHMRATHLPQHGGAYVEFAGDTAAALASGCEGAALALVERSQHAARALLRTSPRLLLHGGGATQLLPHVADAVHAPSLVLEGLAVWARQ